MALYALEIVWPQRGSIWIGSGALAAGALQLTIPAISAALPWLLFVAVGAFGLVANRLAKRLTPPAG